MMTMIFPHPPLSPVMAPQLLQARHLVARQGGDAADAAQGGPETGESQDSKPVAVIDLSGDGDGDNGGQKVNLFSLFL